MKNLLPLDDEYMALGSAVVERLAVDLKLEFPDMGGFSRSNLFYIRKFYLFYRDADEKVLQVVRQIPWGRFSIVNTVIASNLTSPKTHLC